MVTCDMKADVDWEPLWDTKKYLLAQGKKVFGYRLRAFACMCSRLCWPLWISLKGVLRMP